jgi:hypothetical protein
VHEHWYREATIPLYGLPPSYGGPRMIGDSQREYRDDHDGRGPQLVGWQSLGLVHGNPVSGADPALQVITATMPGPTAIELLRPGVELARPHDRRGGLRPRRLRRNRVGTLLGRSSSDRAAHCQRHRRPLASRRPRARPDPGPGAVHLRPVRVHPHATRFLTNGRGRAVARPRPLLHTNGSTKPLNHARAASTSRHRAAATTA